VPWLPLLLNNYVNKQYIPAGYSENVSVFPSPQKGMRRFVINLPTLENENNSKVEIIVGKTMMVDCNGHSLNGSIVEKTVQGWGYTYFEVTKIDGVLSTKMACPGQSDKEELVTLGGEPLFYRYNSKLPVVVYTPGDLQVFYRIWSAN
jgi:ecotin